jgi:hypothetical protein
LPGEAGPISAVEGPKGPVTRGRPNPQCRESGKPDIATIAETDAVGFRTAGEAGLISAGEGP